MLAESNNSRLLVFKSGQDYLRIKDGHVSAGALFQASVYPETELARVRALRSLVAERYPEAVLRLLTLSESDFNGDMS